MPTTIKDSMPGISTEPKAGTQNARRTDAVGVEIPVVVHASRNSVAPREIAKPQPPVHEETRTVIVFPQGAVVRLTASMTAGELVVLTNRRSGADVLCRVASVKAQPGIQNYVDLEFTQRAPGFWGDCFPSEQSPAATPAATPASPQPSGSFAPSFTKPAPRPVAPQVTPAATAPAIPVTPVASVAPLEPLPVSVTPPPAVPAAPAMPPVTFSSLPAMRPEPEAPVATPAAPVVSGGALSMGLMRPQDQQQSWTRRSFESSAHAEETSSGSRKIILIAVAAVVLLSALGGGIVMMRKGATAPSSQPAAATQSLPASSAAISQPSSVAPQQASGAPAKQEPAPTDRANAGLSPRSAEPGVTPPAEELSKSAPLPKRPSRNVVAVVVGKLSAPVAKNLAPAAASSSEAPPVLPASASVGTVGTGLLLGAEASSGPVSPATLAKNTTLVGGRVLDPKLISSSAPTYPPQAALQRVQGDVVVEALVDAKGRVTEAKAISGSPLLQQAAVNAVRLWKYEPARLDGEAVAAHMQVKISFHLP